MGVISKHNYRYSFLQSERWKSIRLEKLATCNARCSICNWRDISNDVHHVFYRKNWSHTQQGDLVVLCRTCHTLVHKHLNKEPKENKAGRAWNQWRKISRKVRNDRQILKSILKKKGALDGSAWTSKTLDPVRKISAVVRRDGKVNFGK